MTSQNVMQPDPVTVVESVPLGQALDLLFRHQVAALPVVDAHGRYRGMFGIAAFLSSLLPRAALLDDHAELTDLGFVHDSLDTLKDRVAGRLQEPVSAFMDHELQPLAPHDSLTEILLRLHRDRRALPVVDATSGRVLGMVTYRSVLSTLTGRPA